MTPPESHTKTRDADATREAILDAASALLRERGFAGASVSAIADAAGVTKSLVHHHFGTKEALYVAVKRRKFEGYWAQQREMLMAASRGDLELLRRSMHLYFHYLMENEDLLELWNWMHAECRSEMDPRGLELTALGIQRVREAQEAGEIRADVSPAVVMAAFRILNEFWFNVRPGFQVLQEGRSVAQLNDDYLEGIMKIFFEGIIPHG